MSEKSYPGVDCNLLYNPLYKDAKFITLNDLKEKIDNPKYHNWVIFSSNPLDLPVSNDLWYIASRNSFIVGVDLPEEIVESGEFDISLIEGYEDQEQFLGRICWQWNRIIISDIEYAYNNHRKYWDALQ